jgi:hypothetical protein
VAARWGADGSVGDVSIGPSGALDAASFKPYDPTAKALYVGTPTMSAVGRALAAVVAGPGTDIVTGTRASALRRGPGGKWGLQLDGRVAGGEAEAARCGARLGAMAVRASWRRGGQRHTNLHAERSFSHRPHSYTAALVQGQKSQLHRRRARPAPLCRQGSRVWAGV